MRFRWVRRPVDHGIGHSDGDGFDRQCCGQCLGSSIGQCCNHRLIEGLGSGGRSTNGRATCEAAIVAAIPIGAMARQKLGLTSYMQLRGSLFQALLS